MIIEYDEKTDLLYIRLDAARQNLINKRVSEDIVLDMGEDEKIIGIEITDASKRVQLSGLLPVSFAMKKAG